MSISSAFAASDDDVAVGGVDEITIDESILAIDEDEDALEAADDADILADSASNVVTNDTFFNYFDASGSLLSNVTADELEFDGDFSGVTVSNITIDRPIKFIGKNTVFNNVLFYIAADNVTIDGFTFTQTNEDSLIEIFQVENVTLSNNIINYHAVADKDCYAIFADVVDNLKLINNTITYIGNTDGTKFNNAVYIGGIYYRNGVDEAVVSPSSNVVIDNNVFDISIPSVDIGYGSYGNLIYSEGIVLYVCENVTFTNNELNVDYNNASGSYDTIYALEVRSDAWTYDFDDEYNLIYPVVSKNVVISDNKINVNGHKYTYALALSGENFEVSGNVFNVTSDDYYADAIVVNGPTFNGVVKDNEIDVTAEGVVYGIYSYAWEGPVSGMVYDNNSIEGKAYAGCGMEIIESAPAITNNTIYLFGNHTTGMAINSINGAISENTIYSGGNNVGNTSSGDLMIHDESTGISVSRNMVIESNTIVSSAIGVNLLYAGDIVLNNNKIEVLSNGAVSNYAVCVDEIDSLNMTGNEIKFFGATDGVSITNGIYIYDTEDISISDNIMSINIPSVPVTWAEVPAGSGNWVPTTLSEGIVIESCTGVEFENNKLNVTYNNVTGVYDTIYAISVKDSDSVSIVDNEITAFGHSYIYAIQISGDAFIISNNTIDVKSDDYYANGIDVEGPASGEISDNIIIVESIGSAYAIYSGMNGLNVSTEITRNNIGAKAYAVFGMSLGDDICAVRDNDILLVGNYTTGIASDVDELEVTGNIISLISSEQGNETITDLFGVESVGIKAISGEVNIENNLIMTQGKGVSLKCEYAVLSKNKIVVESNEDADAYAIYASDLDDLDIVNNTVLYEGATWGTGINNALYIYNVSSSEISENYFNLSLVSSYVPWFEIPAGSGNWVSFPISEGIVVESSDRVKFSENVVDVTYNGVVGAYDTIYAINFKDCDDATIYKNNITALGHTYIYGIQLSGDNFDIVDNIINVTSDSYYANGIDIEGPANGKIWYNDIYVVGVESAYGIYSGMNGQNVSNVIAQNTIYGEAYNVFGMSLGDVESGIIYNDVTLVGNYTTGIAYFGDDLYVGSNDIYLVSSEQGNLTVWEEFGVESVGVKVVKGNATIEDNIITAQGKGVSLTSQDSAVLINNNITVIGNDDADAYAIYAENLNEFNMEHNTVIYSGKTKGNGINNAVYLYNVTNPSVVGNKFNLSLVSSYVPWAEVPAGSGNWVSSPISEGIVFESSDKVIFKSNAVLSNYTNVSGSYDTIYCVVFKDCDDALISNNVIGALGHTYIYAIQVNGEDFNITNNFIGARSDNYYACGIDIEGPSKGDVENNILYVIGVESAYAIYSGMNGESVFASYTNNTINALAYNVFGMSLGDVSSEILNNTLTLIGNYTTGIAYDGYYLVVKNNTISANGSNVGNEVIWESFGVETIGIKVLSGLSNVTDNEIVVTGPYAIDAHGMNAIVHDNYLVGVKYTGDASVKNATKAIVYNNTPVIVPLPVFIGITEVDGYCSISGILVNYDGTPLKNDELECFIGEATYTTTTDADGVFKFANLTNGKVDICYPGDSYRKNATASIILTNIAPLTKTPVSISVTEIDADRNIVCALIAADGTVLANETVNYSFNGTNYTTTTDADGVFKLPIFSKGKVDMSYAGNSDYASVNTSITLNIPDPVPSLISTKFNFTSVLMIKGYAIDTAAGEQGIEFKTMLLDVNGNPLANKTVQLAVNSKVYDQVTNATGGVHYFMNMLKAGRYTMTYVFLGDGTYNSTLSSVCIDLDKKPIKIKASAKSFKSTAKTKKYTVTLSTIVGSSADGKVHLKSGMKVSLKINGKTYTAKTNSKGQATFNLKITKKGKFTTAISYAGDYTYESASKSVVITIN